MAESVVTDIPYRAVGQPVIAGAGEELSRRAQCNQNSNADEQGNHSGKFDRSLTDQQVDHLSGQNGNVQRRSNADGRQKQRNPKICLITSHILQSAGKHSGFGAIAFHAITSSGYWVR